MSHAPPGPAAGTADHLTAEAVQAIRELEASTPDWAPWLRLLERALRAADEPAWRNIDLRFPAARPADAPLLEDARVFVDGPAADQLASDLLETAGRHAPAPDGLALLEAGLVAGNRGAGPAAGAGTGSGSPDPLAATIAQLLARPVLLEAGRRSAPAVPPGWDRGYCPVCGDWPVLVEQRGLERRRVLRCGRCATGWHRPVLHCPFCDERDHRRQGALVPGDERELVRIETCDACGGYVKAVTTLRPRPTWALALDDLRTLPLELAAVDRGYRRTDRPGWPLRVGVAPRPEAVP